MTFEPRIPGTLTVGCAVGKHAACSATGHRKTRARRRFVAGRCFLQAHMALACMLGIFLETRAAALAQPDGALRVTSLRTEYAVNPIGVETERPRLSWKLGARRRGTLQVAYQIRAAHSAEALKRGVDLVWDSGRVRANTSIQLPYDGPPLHSRERTYWRVRVWDNHGLASDWSPVAHFEMGLLLQSDWSAQWIGASGDHDPQASGAPPLLRREFTLDADIQSARVYVTSHGLYQMFLNGVRVGSDEFTPGFTSYDKRLQYQVYDITEQVHSGRNAVGAILGNGWYRGVFGLDSQRNNYGSRIELLAQLEVRYASGRVQRLITDGQWRWATGPILVSEIYDGETYDARGEKDGWDLASYDDRSWGMVRASPMIQAPVAAMAPPVRKIQELKPVRIFSAPNGETIVDLGQNMVGWVRLRVMGSRGTQVTLRHGETLDRNGDLYTANLRSAKQEVSYVLRGGRPEVFEPHFTFQGFRYVAVTGYPGVLTAANITGIVLHSDLERTGRVITSDRRLNQLEHNILWGQKGNFLDIPTDCPQRNERLGWTGDAQVFSATAAWNMDVASFFTKWLSDLAADQYDDGAVPFVVPDVMRVFRLSQIHAADFPGPFPDQEAGGAAGWGDAATVIPWNLYLAYGDRRILESQYPSMVRWVQFENSRAGSDHIWKGDFQFADWLDFLGSERGTRFGSTAPDLVATAYFAHSTDLLQRIATVLGKREDAAHYAELFERIGTAFRRRFVTDDARVGDGTQTAYVLALDFDLLPPEMRSLAAMHLVADVRERGHLTTGFLGTPHLLNVLSRFGYTQDAYRLLEREEYPSWLYPVMHGATTIWERWDGLRPDGTFQSSEMNSFNHYAYGAVGEWMYGVMGGVETDPDAPGYKHMTIRPQPGGGLTSVSVSHETPYGAMHVDWQRQLSRLDVSLEIPANTSATVRLPQARLMQVLEGDRPLAKTRGVSAPRQDGDGVMLELGSGRYEFRYPVLHASKPR